VGRPIFLILIKSIHVFLQFSQQFLLFTSQLSKIRRVVIYCINHNKIGATNLNVKGAGISQGRDKNVDEVFSAGDDLHVGRFVGVDIVRGGRFVGQLVTLVSILLHFLFDQRPCFLHFLGQAFDADSLALD